MRPIPILAGLLVVTALLFAPTLGYPFVYEDGRDVAALMHPSQLVEQAAIYPLRGLPKLSFALDGWLLGPQPWGYHLGSLGWHLVNTALAFGLFWLVLPPMGAIVATGLFAWHPLQVEAVAYVSSRPDLLAGLGVLLALLATSLGSLPGALIGVVLASLGKETAVVAWGLVPLWAVWTRAAFPLKWWLYLAAVGLSAGSVFASGRIDALTFAVSPPLIGATFAAIARLVSLLFVPMGLTIDHDWSWTLAAWPVALMAGLLVTCWAATLGWHRRSWLAFAWLWTVVALAPRFVVPLYEGLHEHHFYLPILGWCLSAGYWLSSTRTDKGSLACR